MYCNNCGKELPDGAKFCDQCGAAQSSEEAVSAPLNIKTESTTPKLKNNIVELLKSYFKKPQAAISKLIEDHDVNFAHVTLVIELVCFIIWGICIAGKIAIETDQWIEIYGEMTGLAVLMFIFLIATPFLTTIGLSKVMRRNVAPATAYINAVSGNLLFFMGMLISGLLILASAPLGFFLMSVFIMARELTLVPSIITLIGNFLESAKSLWTTVAVKFGMQFALGLIIYAIAKDTVDSLIYYLF